MRPSRRAAHLAVLIGLAALVPVALGVQGRALRPFMRQKLAYAQAILEGMAIEDHALILKNAKALRELSEDAQWRVSPNVNYLRLSNEFQALADELAAKASDRNLDGVTLAFFKLTNNCVACHRLVRDERLVSLAR